MPGQHFVKHTAECEIIASDISRLATHLFERDCLDAEAETLARSLAEGGVLATRTTKSWLNELDGSLEDAVLDRAADLSADVIASEEAQARLRALFGRDRV